MNCLHSRYFQKRRFSAYLMPFVFLSVLMAAGSAVGKSGTEDLPSGEEILDRYVKATGGMEAYEALKNRVSRGTLDVMGIKGSITTYEAMPNRSLTVMELPGFGEDKSGTVDQIAWELSTMNGARLCEGEERESSLRMAALAQEAFWRNHFEKAECAGKERVGAQVCYKVIMTPAKGGSETWFFDTETHLLSKTEAAVHTSMGVMSMEFFFDDYRKVGGLLVPHKREIKNAFQSCLIVCDSIEHNVDLPDTQFDPPKEVKDLLAEAEGRKTQPEVTLEQKTEWVKKNAVVFDTAEAGKKIDDLMPLKDLIGDSRIVALGEATHGTREFFQMKHRVLEFLAKEMGFTVFSIEANMPESYRVSDFVLKGRGDPEDLLDGMYFWTWNTEEVRDMILWMRDFNESGEKELTFTGFDMQTPDIAMQIVLDFFNENDPDYYEELKETFLKVKTASAGSAQGGAFGVATAMFPVEVAAGKRIRYSGYIKTEEITEGFAGLWWRVDGADGVLGFDNMRHRGPKGTTDWKRYEIEMEVHADVVHINFGVLHPGTGIAWFDALKVEVDGVTYSNDDHIDLGFESDKPKGFFTRGAGYEVGLDQETVYEGKQSLRSYKIPKAEEDRLNAEQAADLCGTVVEQIESLRKTLLKTHAAYDVEWIVQNARVVHQCYQMYAAQAHRDLSMAKNIKWILDQAPPETKIVLWAHNGHVNRIGRAMGAILDEWYGDQMVVVGFTCAEGRYTAVGDEGLDSHDIAPPEPGSVEHCFQHTGLPRFMLDLRNVSKETPTSAWLAKPVRFRSIGALAMDNQFYPTDLCKAFDLLIYFEKTTASRLLNK